MSKRPSIRSAAARSRPRTLVAVVALLVAVTFLVGLGPASAKNAPPGNKGTVKIDDELFNGIPDNDPHPGCLFDLQFFFFPRVTTATYTFTLIPPTSDGSTGGSIALDPTKKPNAHRVVNLASFLASSHVAPHPIQGFHVKLTIHTHSPGPAGADVKHKVFWVKCATTTPTPTPTPTSTPPGTTTPPVTTTPPGTTTPPTVLAVTPHRRPTKVLGVTLAKTGSRGHGFLVLWGALFVAAGLLLVRLSGAPEGRRYGAAAEGSFGFSLPVPWAFIGRRALSARTRSPPRGPP